MHEMPVAQNIFDIVTEYATEHDAARVTRVHLKIGAMTGVVEDSVRFYWESLTIGTVAEGAVLDVEVVPITAVCYSCGEEYSAVDQFALFCTACAAFGGRVTSGKELTVESIEIIEKDGTAEAGA